MIISRDDWYYRQPDIGNLNAVMMISQFQNNAHDDQAL